VLEGESGTMADALRAIASGNPTEQQVALASTVARYNAQLRTTCVATRIEGGHADNALPQRARATVNCRLLPGEPEEFVRRELERVSGPRVAVTAQNKIYPSEATDTRTAEMAAIAEVARLMWPGVEVIPIMSAGATDGSRLRNAGIPVYGMLPIFMGAADLVRMHGQDERIPAAAFYEGRRYMERLVRRLAGAP
jgi:acetylornithine deacetylase/succinyl-diaminopimelate desuccinylase-like protein